MDTETIFTAYLEYALQCGKPLDRNYDISDIAEESLAELKIDVLNFVQVNEELLELSGLNDEQIGHDFWLSRCGHGAGFFDRYSQTTCERYEKEQEIAMVTRDFSKRENLIKTCDCPYHVCQRLQEAARVYGNVDLYVGDDGRIYSFP